MASSQQPPKPSGPPPLPSQQHQPGPHQPASGTLPLQNGFGASGSSHPQTSANETAQRRAHVPTESFAPPVGLVAGPPPPSPVGHKSPPGSSGGFSPSTAYKHQFVSTVSGQTQPSGQSQSRADLEPDRPTAPASATPVVPSHPASQAALAATASGAFGPSLSGTPHPPSMGEQSTVQQFAGQHPNLPSTGHQPPIPMGGVIQHSQQSSRTPTLPVLPGHRAGTPAPPTTQPPAAGSPGPYTQSQAALQPSHTGTFGPPVVMAPGTAGPASLGSSSLQNRGAPSAGALPGIAQQTVPVQSGVLPAEGLASSVQAPRASSPPAINLGGRTPGSVTPILIPQRPTHAIPIVTQNKARHRYWALWVGFAGVFCLLGGLSLVGYLLTGSSSGGATTAVAAAPAAPPPERTKTETAATTPEAPAKVVPTVAAATTASAAASASAAPAVSIAAATAAPAPEASGSAAPGPTVAGAPVIPDHSKPVAAKPAAQPREPWRPKEPPASGKKPKRSSSKEDEEYEPGTK